METSQALQCQLPSECMLAVLRGLTDDQRSLFSCARASSDLRKQGAPLVNKIRADVKQQQQVDSVLVYLDRYQQHINSITLQSEFRQPVLTMRELPSGLKLNLLTLKCLKLQLQPGGGFEGVLRPGAHIQQLHIDDCMLLDGASALAAALPLLPQLDHLRVNHIQQKNGDRVRFPGDALLQLPQLTRLELCLGSLHGPSTLQYISTLTALQDLRMDCPGEDLITAHSFEPLQRLTTLRALGAEVEVGALAGRTQLRELWLLNCTIAGQRAGVAALLSELQFMTQLTDLCMRNTLRCIAAAPGELNDAESDAELEDSDAEEDALHGAPPHAAAAAYAALTASSSLVELDLDYCCLPRGAWQNMFPPERPLPNLRQLVWQPVRFSGDAADLDTDDMARLAACAPRLRCLRLPAVRQTADMLAHLRGLADLQELVLSKVTDGGAGVLAQMSGLKRLQLRGPSDITDVGLLQLTSLQQLTHLTLESFRIRQLTDTLVFDSKVSTCLCRTQSHAHTLHCSCLRCKTISGCTSACRCTQDSMCAPGAAAVHACPNLACLYRDHLEYLHISLTTLLQQPCCCTCTFACRVLRTNLSGGGFSTMPAPVGAHRLRHRQNRSLQHCSWSSLTAELSTPAQRGAQDAAPHSTVFWCRTQ